MPLDFECSVWYSGMWTLPHGADGGDISIAKFDLMPSAVLPILVSTSDNSCPLLFFLIARLRVKDLTKQQYMMYKRRMVAIRIAIISMIPKMD